jgi:hypothetical protein
LKQAARSSAERSEAEISPALDPRAVEIPGVTVDVSTIPGVQIAPASGLVNLVEWSRFLSLARSSMLPPIPFHQIFLHIK